MVVFWVCFVGEEGRVDWRKEEEVSYRLINPGCRAGEDTGFQGVKRGRERRREGKNTCHTDLFLKKDHTEEKEEEEEKKGLSKDNRAMLKKKEEKRWRVNLARFFWFWRSAFVVFH